jgi:hypothetical protein
MFGELHTNDNPSLVSNPFLYSELDAKIIGVSFTFIGLPAIFCNEFNL